MLKVHRIQTSVLLNIILLIIMYYDGIVFMTVPQEYPSIAMVKSLLLENGISPIFLVTHTNLAQYSVSILWNLRSTLYCGSLCLASAVLDNL